MDEEEAFEGSHSQSQYILCCHKNATSQTDRDTEKHLLNLSQSSNSLLGHHPASPTFTAYPQYNYSSSSHAALHPCLGICPICSLVLSLLPWVAFLSTLTPFVPTIKSLLSFLALFKAPLLSGIIIRQFVLGLMEETKFESLWT